MTALTDPDFSGGLCRPRTHPGDTTQGQPSSEEPEPTALLTDNSDRPPPAGGRMTGSRLSPHGRDAQAELDMTTRARHKREQGMDLGIPGPRCQPQHRAARQSTLPSLGHGQDTVSDPEPPGGETACLVRHPAEEGGRQSGRPGGGCRKGHIQDPGGVEEVTVLQYG